MIDFEILKKNMMNNYIMELAKIRNSNLDLDLKELFFDYNEAIEEFIGDIKGSTSPIDKALIKFLKQAKDNKEMFSWCLEQSYAPDFQDFMKSLNLKPMKANLMIGGAPPAQKWLIFTFIVQLIIIFIINFKQAAQPVAQWKPRIPSPPAFTDTLPGQVAVHFVNTVTNFPITAYQQRDNTIMGPINVINTYKDITAVQFEEMKTIISTAINATKPQSFAPYISSLSNDGIMGVLPASLSEINYKSIAKVVDQIKIYNTKGLLARLLSGSSENQAELITKHLQTILIHKIVNDLLKSAEKFLDVDNYTNITRAVNNLEKAFITHNQSIEMIKNMPWTDLKSHIKTNFIEEPTVQSSRKATLFERSIEGFMHAAFTTPVTVATSAAVNVTREATHLVQAGSHLAGNLGWYTLATAVAGAVAAGALKLKNSNSDDSKLAKINGRKLVLNSRAFTVPLLKAIIDTINSKGGRTVAISVSGNKPDLVDRIVAYENANNVEYSIDATDTVIETPRPRN